MQPLDDAAARSRRMSAPVARAGWPSAGLSPDGAKAQGREVALRGEGELTRLEDVPDGPPDSGGGIELEQGHIIAIGGRLVKLVPALDQPSWTNTGRRGGT